ncbi:transglutaminase-like domain-containing protein [Demequina sp.]|uniref:transglutaminase-like domain-containing protein n=1 Tax=Demequina sp. TaxID=2050685 RepID=UPI003D0BACFC
MHRSVGSTLTLDVLEPAHLILSVAVASAEGLEIDESLVVELDGRALEVKELADGHGTRLHTLDSHAGRLTVRYEAEVDGRAEAPAFDELDIVRNLRPSRYCESDTLFPTAAKEFEGLTGRDLFAAVTSWVGTHLEYIPGSSQPTDGAVQTLLARQGVCRDFAHLSVALLRARDVPARLVSVYAPGLDPMDFHAVCEANIDGQWYVVDATTLAPRQSLLRIATGRDASDTAFVSTHHGHVQLAEMDVRATVDALPTDDVTSLVTLG